MSSDGKYVALSDRHDQHNVYLFDIMSGKTTNQPGGTNKIFDICFSAKHGDYTFATVGSKHIKFWDNTLNGHNGIFGKAGEMTSFACVAFDDNGICYSGGSNAQIYVWQGKNLNRTIKAHKGGFVGAIRWVGGKLYSGGKDGVLNVINTSNDQVEKSIDFGGVLLRAIDV